MYSTMKKTLIIGGSVIGIILLGVVGYFAASLLLKKNPGTGANNTSPSAGVETSENSGPITSVGDASILAYFVESDGVVALQTTGEVVETKNNKTTALSSAKLSSLIGASFSADGKKILAKFGTLRDYHYTMFDRQVGSWAGISNDKIVAADWSPSTHEIVYLEKVSNGSNIVILDTDKLKDPKKPELGLLKTVVGSLNELDSNVLWLNSDEILISPKPARYVPSTILKYNLKEKIFTAIVSNVLGAAFNWDRPSGLGLGYFFTAQSGVVTLIDASGGTRGQMGFVTMPEKCAFASAYLYCAVPEDLKGATLPDDYLMKAVFFKDRFYRISLTDGKTESLLNDVGGEFDAQAMQVSRGSVYFINNLDGRLYQFTPIVK
jgi:hypothetical protein